MLYMPARVWQAICHTLCDLPGKKLHGDPEMRKSYSGRIIPTVFGKLERGPQKIYQYQFLKEGSNLVYPLLDPE
jgi:hypothetical protein